MTDDMLRALAKNNGVAQVNFFSGFVDEDYRKATAALAKDRDAAVEAFVAQHKAEGKTVTYVEYDRIDESGPPGFPEPPFKSPD